MLASDYGLKDAKALPRLIENADTDEIKCRLSNIEDKIIRNVSSRHVANIVFTKEGDIFPHTYKNMRKNKIARHPFELDEMYFADNEQLLCCKMKLHVQGCIVRQMRIEGRRQIIGSILLLVNNLRKSNLRGQKLTARLASDLQATLEELQNLLQALKDKPADEEDKNETEMRKMVDAALKRARSQVTCASRRAKRQMRHRRG